MNSINTKILTISLTLLICLSVIFGLYSIITTNVYQRLRLESIRRTIKYEAAKANTVITLIERNVVQLATSGLVFYYSQSLEIGELSAVDLLRSFPAATGGGYWFEPYAYNENILRMGIHAYHCDETDDIILDDISEDYDYHSLDWYREIIDKVQTPYQIVWIKPYIDDTTEKMVITAGAGIFNLNGDLLGISIIDWKVEEVIRELATIKPTENSIVLMYDPEHENIIVHTHTHSEKFPDIKAADSSTSRIPKTIKAASQTWQEEYDVGISLYLLDDVLNVALSRAMNNGWFLYVYSPINEIFMDTANRNRLFTLTISLISIITLCIAYFLISKIILKPIKKLTTNIAQISLGNLDITTEVTSNDELGLLAQAFNKMTLDLKTSIEAYTREHIEKERIGAELNIAAEIQLSMLPCNFPPFPERKEFDIYATMHPAKEVGGDFYDFFFVDDDILAIVIADVAGKGVPAALYMVITKILIENNATSNKSLNDVFQAVNKSICDNNDTGMFVTAFMGYYYINTGKFVYVNAGHNPPLLLKFGIRNSEFGIQDFELGTAEGVPYKTPNSELRTPNSSTERVFNFLTSKPNNILGWKKDVVFNEVELSLEPGDVIYLYTDGVTEAMNKDLELYSETRLYETINKYKDLPPKELLLALKNEIEIYSTDTEQADDITMLALKVEDAQPQDLLRQNTFCQNTTLQASIENLSRAMDFINDVLDQHDCPHNIKTNIDIALEEIFVNIVEYAYPPTNFVGNAFSRSEFVESAFNRSEFGIPNSELQTPNSSLEGQISLKIIVENGEAIITIEDTGRAFNPLESPEPDLDAPLIDRDIGGLGVFLVTKIMDKVHYSRQENKNIFTMTKKILEIP